MAAIDLHHPPGDPQHVLVAPEFAEGRRVLTQQIEIRRHPLHRPGEPRQRSGKALRIPDQLTLEGQRLWFFGIERERPGDGVGGEMLLAPAITQAADIDPQPRTAAAGLQRAVERLRRGGEIAGGEFEPAEGMETPRSARRIEPSRFEPAARFVEIAFDHRRLAEVRGRRILGRSGPQRTAGGDFGGNSVSPFDCPRRLGKRIAARHRQRRQRQEGQQRRQQDLVRPAGHTA